MKSRDLFNQLIQELSSSYSPEESQALSYLILSHYLKVDKKDVILNEDIHTTFDFSKIIEAQL